MSKLAILSGAIAAALASQEDGRIMLDEAGDYPPDMFDIAFNHGPKIAQREYRRRVAASPLLAAPYGRHRTARHPYARVRWRP